VPHPVQAIICVLALLAIGCRPAEPTPALPPNSPPTIAAQSAVKATPSVQPDPNTAQIIYLRGDYGAPGEVVAVGADGGEPRVLAALPSFNSATNGLDVDAASGAFVYTADLAGSLWSGALADRPHKITDGAGGWHVPSPRISPDGRTVAYAVHRERSAPSEPQPPPSEVWLVGIDGRGGRKLAEDTQRLISFPFGLSPIGWSGDGSKIYLLATAESEYVPTGPYQVDVATGAIERAPMPYEPPWSLALSPNGNYLAYSTWAIDPDWLVLPIPPYRLRVTDLRTGNTTTVLESGEQLYGPIVWSPEGDRLLVSVEEAWSEEDGEKPEEPGRFIGVDIGTGQTWEPAAWIEDLPVDLTPQLWLPGERVVLVDGAGALVVLDLNDERWVELELDEAPEVVVMGYMLPEGGENADVDRLVQSSNSYGPGLCGRPKADRHPSPPVRIHPRPQHPHHPRRPHELLPVEGHQRLAQCLSQCDVDRVTAADAVVDGDGGGALGEAAVDGDQVDDACADEFGNGLARQVRVSLPAADRGTDFGGEDPWRVERLSARQSVAMPDNRGLPMEIAGIAQGDLDARVNDCHLPSLSSSRSSTPLFGEIHALPTSSASSSNSLRYRSIFASRRRSASSGVKGRITAAGSP
jgi:hypothetical protein